MNLQNGTLDTRLPQNIIRNFKIPANVEHDKLNPFKIGGGNAIWATHLPQNVNVWFSTNPNFDNAQKLDYMNRGMRFMSIGSDGLQQQYDNFYIFTEGTWNDMIKIAVSSQGDMVEPILSSNTGDIENVGRVASITKMPVNGASGYNKPDFEIWCRNKVAAKMGLKANYVYFQKFDFDLLNILPNKKYLFEIDSIWQGGNLYVVGGDYSFANNITFLSFCFLDLTDLKSIEFDEYINERLGCNIEPFFIYKQSTEGGLLQQDITPNVSLYDLLKNDKVFLIQTINLLNNNFLKNDSRKIIINGKDLYKKIPVILMCPGGGNDPYNFAGFFNFNVRIYSL